MFGYNVQALSINESAKNGAIQHFRRLGSASTLVMDNYAWAIDLKNEFPDMLVIARQNDIAAHRTDDNIDKQMSVQEFWNRWESKYNDRRILVHINNEPSDEDSTTDWIYNATVEGLKRGFSMVIANYSVGVPNENDVLNGRFDKLIRIVSDNIGRVYLGLHEYAGHHWYSGIDGYLAKNRPPESVSLNKSFAELRNFVAGKDKYFMGRYEFWLRRAAQIGANLKIIFTEFGWDVLNIPNDVVGIAGQHRCKPTWEQWYPEKNWEIYAAEQINQAVNVLYSNNSVAGICAFALNATPDWWSFNYSDMTNFIREVENMTWPNTTDLPPSNGPIGLDCVKLNGIPRGLNFRDRPTTRGSNVITTLAAGSVVMLTGEETNTNGFNWYEAYASSGIKGWFAGVRSLEMIDARCRQEPNYEAATILIDEIDADLADLREKML